jgi:hypothetical protein
VGLVGSPQIAASGDYSREIGPRHLVETRGERTVITPRSSLAIRIQRFAVSNGCDKDLAPELAELLAECQYPRVLAAIACRESGFDLKARGSVGERGMYQIRPEVWGDPGRTVRSQTKKAEKVLLTLLDEHGGLSRAVERYNGSGRDAAHYRDQVLRLARSI